MEYMMLYLSELILIQMTFLAKYIVSPSQVAMSTASMPSIGSQIRPTTGCTCWDR